MSTLACLLRHPRPLRHSRSRQQPPEKRYNYTLPLSEDKIGQFYSTKLVFWEPFFKEKLFKCNPTASSVRSLKYLSFRKNLAKNLKEMECYDMHFAVWWDLRFCSILLRPICSKPDLQLDRHICIKLTKLCISY